MFSKASTPSKTKIIFDAFHSEFDEKFAKNADAALFRDLIETLDYNEALVLCGVAAMAMIPGVSVVCKVHHPSYHTARSLLRKGELCIAVISEDRDNRHINIMPTAALKDFIEFVRVEGGPTFTRR